MRKHQLILLAFLVFFAELASAQTKVFLHDALSPAGTTATSGAGIGCYRTAGTYVFRLADTNQGTAAVSKSFQPTATAPPCLAQTANGGQFLRWITPPLAASVTISQNIDYQVGCGESATGMNMGVGFKIFRWTPAGGIVSTVHNSGATTECSSGSVGLKTIAAAAPTSTTFNAGDRLVIQIELRATAGWGGNSSRTATVRYDDVSAGTGDTWIHFLDTFSFSADSPPAMPYVQ